jgi:hypothetical protein
MAAIRIILPGGVLYERVSHNMGVEGVMRQSVVEYNVRRFSFSQQLRQIESMFNGERLRYVC